MDVWLLLRITRRWIALIVATGVLAASVTYIATSFLPRSYESRATLLVGQGLESARLDYTQILAAQLQAQTYAAVATDRSALETTIERLGLEMSPEQLARQTRAEAASGSRFVEVVAVDANADRAADIANGIAEYLIGLTSGSTSDEILATIRRELAATEEEVASAEAELELLAQEPPSPDRTERTSDLTGQVLTLRSIRASLLAQASEGSANPLTIVNEAAPSGEPTGVGPVWNAVLAATLAVIVATILAVFLNRLAPADIGPPRVEGPARVRTRRKALPE